MRALAERLADNETQLKRQVVKTLRHLGFLVYVTSERRRGYSKFPPGWPDCFARHITRRFAVWIEVKQRGEQLRPEQEDFREAALGAGENHWTLDTMGGLLTHLSQVGFVIAIHSPRNT